MKRPNKRLKLVARVNYRISSAHAAAYERCSRQALFGCGFAAMVVECLQLN